jgi:hypothetical protein
MSNDLPVMPLPADLQKLLDDMQVPVVPQVDTPAAVETQMVAHMLAVLVKKAGGQVAFDNEAFNSVEGYDLDIAGSPSGITVTVIPPAKVSE